MSKIKDEYHLVGAISFSTIFTFSLYGELTATSHGKFPDEYGWNENMYLAIKKIIKLIYVLNLELFLS